MTRSVNTARWTALLLRCMAAALLPLLTLHTPAQTNLLARSSRADTTAMPGLSTTDSGTTNEAVRGEEIRAACLEGRRCVCGRVLKVFPNGVLVESGYPTLMRPDLHGAWHLPRTVVARRDPNLVERKEPDAICVGMVFLTDLPKPRGAKKEQIEPYDYVVLHSYPAGYYTYSSVGNIRHTVRRFSGGLETAVRLTQFPPEGQKQPAVR